MTVEAMAAAYHFIGTRDRHLIRLFHWIKIIESLADEVRASEMDEELYKELGEISNRLTKEVGVRSVAIFPIGQDAK